MKADELLTVNGAWYLDNLPTMLVTEKIDGALAMFNMQMFRKVRPDELQPYKGHHPRRCKGHPLPDYLYRFYGLARNEESLSEVIRVRVSPSEKEKLEAAATNTDNTVSEFLREYIRGL
jgi:hypothetical protein